jgi:CTP:molybdopterin cytidylyltransferase MocA
MRETFADLDRWQRNDEEIALATLVRVHGSAAQAGAPEAGLERGRSRALAAAVLLGDQPQVGAGLIHRGAAAFPGGGSPTARPVYSGAGGCRIPGHPVFLARRIWPGLETLCGDQGARALFSARPDWPLEIPVEGEPPGDVDTWDDYRQLVDVARSR